MSVQFIVRAKRMAHVRGLIRAAGYLSVTTLVFCGFSVRAARAEARNRTMELGREMLDFAQASSHDVTPMTLNGQTLYLGSSVSDDAPDTILDRYEGACKADPGQPAMGWKEVETANHGPVKDAPQIATGAMRARSADGAEGSVVCFMRGENTKATVGEAFASFMQTGELGALGKLRYVYAKKSKQSGRTLVLTAWTDSKFNLVEMMPDGDKDVPGYDFPELPRVPNSVRALSATSEGLPYGVNVYRTTDAPQATLAFYDTEMVKAGWHGYNPELKDAEYGGQGRTYVKDGVVLSLGTKVQPEGNFVALGLAGVPAH